MKEAAKKTIVLIISVIMIMMAATLSACGSSCVLYNYTVRYKATEGGWIEGKAKQRIFRGKDAEPVTAVANDGYRFVGWNDNPELPEERQDKIVLKSIKVTAVFERIILECNYYAGEHGKIEGKTEQIVNCCENAETVTAIADYSYEFTGWSDGVLTAERQDLNVQDNINVTACFGKIEKTFKLDYKFGVAENNVTELLINYENIDEVELPVPEREHFTFGGWYLDDLQIADENGELLFGKDLFNLKGTEIYAKWTANETFTYKILLVYVTSIRANIPTRDNSRIVNINYKMTEFEKEVAHELTRQVKTTLDDMLDGLVEFVVDEYFTTTTLGNESISSGTDADRLKSYNIDARDIEEVKNLVDNYQSVFSIFNFEDYYHDLHLGAGLGDRKYAMIFFDSMLRGLHALNEKRFNVTEISQWKWDQAAATVIHELIHTIEMRINSYEYHSLGAKYLAEGEINSLYVEKLYLLHEAEIDNQKVGIPYEFWGKDELIS